MTTLPESEQQPQPAFDAVLAAVAASKVDLMAERDALRMLAASRGDNAASYRLLAVQALHHFAKSQTALRRERQRNAELRQRYPDAAEFVRLKEENATLQGYVLLLQNELYERDMGLAA